MCDYRIESRQTLAALGSISHLQPRLGNRAFLPLARKLRFGHVRFAHDLQDGSPLSQTSIAAGHYLTPANFNRLLARLAKNPSTCDWCHSALPSTAPALHLRGDYDIRPFFHSQCWTARMLALCVIFGHLRPQQILTRKQNRPTTTVYEAVEVVVRKFRGTQSKKGSSC